VDPRTLLIDAIGGGPPPHRQKSPPPNTTKTNGDPLENLTRSTRTGLRGCGPRGLSPIIRRSGARKKEEKERVKRSWLPAAEQAGAMFGAVHRRFLSYVADGLGGSGRSRF